MFENPRRGRQARNFTTNVPKILDLQSSSEQIFFRKLSLGALNELCYKHNSVCSSCVTIFLFFCFLFSSFAYFVAKILITLYLRSEIALNENVTDRLKSSILQHQSARYLMHISSNFKVFALG